MIADNGERRRPGSVADRQGERAHKRYQAIGQYAVRLILSSGHETGLYSRDYLLAVYLANLELDGTAIETSLTGTFQVVLHKKDELKGGIIVELDFPLLETADEWLVHGFSYANYLDALGEDAQSEIYPKSSMDNAMRDAFRKMRRFLMTTQRLTEHAAISLMTVAADFGITQVVDGNRGVHGTLKKSVFAGRD